MTTAPQLAMVDVMGYPGGKNGSGVYQAIINQMPLHDVYIEPFLGGGAVMRLKRPAALNIGIDLEPGSIAVCVDAQRRTSPQVAASAETSESGGMRSPVTRYGGGVLQAACTTESDRLTTKAAVPAAIAGSGEPSGSTTTIGGVAGDRAKGGGAAGEFVFLNEDAIGFLGSYRFTGSELVYCDPPYVHSTRGRKDLYEFEMTDGQHIKLLDVLCSLPCRVMLSGYRSELYVQRLKGWRVTTFQTVNRAGQKTTEWLWMNYEQPMILHDYRYLGKDYRERERIKKKKTRWVEKLRRMPILERQALMSAIGEM